MENPSGVEKLSARQKEILRLVAQNHQAKEIARLLDIGERTVKTHTEAARERLGVATSRDAARLLVAYEAQATPQTGVGRDDRGAARPIPDAADPAKLPLAAEGAGPSGDGARDMSHLRAVPDIGPPDGKYTRLQAYLRRLNPVQWIGLILVLALVSTLLVSGLLIAAVGMIEAIEHVVARLE
ncbi:helix-turn-helix transcriptional regulator [Asticcacaulis sp. BYS171W]|uniref:Helix-turn-helix transcriptional regulator n=1 Tax=Asticcacaulis aquaticus TaxID=2984212 RepID=A0ABT5HYL7_9CAUL|nr:helix-turn-helix transcriptional regulator [Asticcacaulis aquaticus]